MKHGFPVLLSLLISRDWIDYANFVVLTATLVVVALYTRLTQKLRLGAERQNRLSVLPILILDWPNPEFDKSDTPSVENIGTGPAFNVQIAPIEHGAVKVDFPQFGLLQVKDRNAPFMHISKVVEDSPGHRIQHGYQPSTQTLADLIQRNEFPDTFNVTIRYDDLVRKSYTTAFDVSFDRFRGEFTVKYSGMVVL